MKPDYMDRVRACEVVGAGPGWNARYRRALRENGLALKAYDGDGEELPEGIIHAPLALEGDPQGWPPATLIVER